MISAYDNVNAVNLAANDTHSSSIDGTAIDIRDYTGEAMILLTAGVSAAGTLDCKIQECDTSDGSFEDVSGATFTQITTEASMQKIQLNVDARKRYIKLVGAIASSWEAEVACVFLAKKHIN